MLHDSEFYRRLSERILAERLRKIEGMILGHSEMQDYRTAVGYIQGLDFVTKEAQIVHDDMMGVKREPREEDE